MIVNYLNETKVHGNPDAESVCRTLLRLFNRVAKWELLHDGDVTQGQHLKKTWKRLNGLVGVNV